MEVREVCSAAISCIDWIYDEMSEIGFDYLWVFVGHVVDLHDCVGGDIELVDRPRRVYHVHYDSIERGEGDVVNGEVAFISERQIITLVEPELVGERIDPIITWVKLSICYMSN